MPVSRRRASLSFVARFSQALYILYRMYYLWDTFSRLHMAAFAATTITYARLYFFLAKAAAPKYAPLAQGGALVSGGSDLNSKGVLEYTWDLLYTTLFIQLTTGFISDWFWLLGLVPPSIGLYYLWTMVIYPWISKPDEDPAAAAAAAADRKQKVKYGKAR